MTGCTFNSILKGFQLWWENLVTKLKVKQKLYFIYCELNIPPTGILGHTPTCLLGKSIQFHTFSV